ncbi:MAG: tol-pal system protein YbgF [Magnetospirillum sp.]
MRRLAAFVVLAGLALQVQPAHAQYENRAMSDRLERLERDLQMIQAQMARGGTTSGGSTVITSPALGGGTSSTRPANTVSPMSAGMAVRLDERVDQLEDLVRQLTGRVEEAAFKAQQVSKQLERLQADIDLRFKDLQAAQAPAQSAEGGQAQVSMPAAKGGDQPAPASAPQTLGTLSDKDLKKPAANNNAPVAPPKDAQGQYDMAYEALQRGAYPEAEKGFQDFLAKYSSHQLAGNAQYWLGDIAYVRKDFNTAAVTFLEGYKKFSNHPKAADMIYKAGSSFGQMGKTKEACTAFGILFKDQAKMPDRVKRAATAEKQKYNCK